MLFISQGWQPLSSLRPDQIEDLATLINNPKIVLANEPGTGKTPTICTYQRFLLQHKQKGSVWLMPNSLLKKNLDEARAWGGWSAREAVIVKDNNPPSDAVLYLVGFDRFAKVGAKLPKNIQAVQVDESHKGYMGDESARTQALYAFSRKRGVEDFVPMTGTLFRGKPDSCYPVISLIEPRYYGNFLAFKNTHHELDPWSGKIVGYKNLEKLGRIIEHHSMRRTFEQIFGRQEVVFQVETIQMAPQQEKLYDQFEAQALLELEKFWVDGTQPGVGFIRARQILEHPERFPDLSRPGEKAWVDILEGETSGKLERITEHLEDAADMGKPILIYAALRAQQDLIATAAEQLGFRVGMINGDVSPSQRGRIDEAFQAGRLNCIVASPECADVGFNWQFCGNQEVQHVLVASLPYDDSTFIQAYRRAVRRKRSTCLRVTVLRYNASVDYRVFQIVNSKSEMACKVDPTRERIQL